MIYLFSLLYYRSLLSSSKYLLKIYLSKSIILNSNKIYKFTLLNEAIYTILYYIIIVLLYYHIILLLYYYIIKLYNYYILYY